MKHLYCCLLFCLIGVASPAQGIYGKTDAWLEQLLRSKATPFLLHVLDQPDTFQYQFIYTRIDRDGHNAPKFTNYYLHVDRNRYYNPASTVKLPTVLAALEKLNGWHQRGVGKYAAMQLDSSFSGQQTILSDTSSANGYPSIANYIKKIFLVSDNDAYNRLYEFTGQQTLNETLWKKGYPDVRIVRQFMPMTEEENRHTNAIRFLHNGKTIYTQPAAYSSASFDFSKQVLVGKGHLDQHDNLIMTPFDFTRHNNLPLEDLREMVQSVIFPQSVPVEKRFHLTKDDYKLLYRYMSAYPSESDHPHYDTSEYFDSYTKFFWFRAGKQPVPAGIRSYNKPGWSYGYLTDAAYITDEEHGVEFMLSAVIYVNSDGILNDDKYDYDEVGYPFFREIGKIMYDYELQRKKEYLPRLLKVRRN